MCGVAGWFDLKIANTERAREEIREMGSVLHHRGPDDEGYLVEGPVALASTRLSVLDLSPNGHMPMESRDGRYVIVQNGEIYNYRELREDQEKAGTLFHSSGDTEVLIELYARYGPEMLPKLNGMFAIAIWDRSARALFLARDRFGVKPLYWAERSGRFVFGSEPRALFATGVPREFDESCWPELLCFRYVAGERTPFRGVFRLLPGHCMTVSAEGMKTRRWWSLDELPAECDEASRGEEAERELDRLFRRSIDYRRISDVPVGVLLSGGLDSSSVSAVTAEAAGKGVASFTVRFSDGDYDEGPTATLVGQRFGLEQNELMVDDRDLHEQLIEATHYLEEPLVHANDPHLLAISRLAKGRVTVLLSGEGSDEILAGYVRYLPFRYPSLARAAGATVASLRALPWPARVKKGIALFSLHDPLERVLFSSAEIMPSEIGVSSRHPGLDLRRQLAEASVKRHRDPLRQVMGYELQTYLSSILDRNDKMTMAAGIECREPFLDPELVSFTWKLPVSELVPRWRGKGVLRRAMRKRLPAEVLDGRKWGFGVPWIRYFRRVPELTAELSEAIRHPQVAEELGRLSIDGTKLVRDFVNGRDEVWPLLRQVVLVAIWLRTCIDVKERQVSRR